VKKIKVERFNKDMAPFFKMAPQQFEEQVLKFEQETNDFINEGTNESSQRSIQKSRGHPLGDHARASPLILCFAQAWFPGGKHSRAKPLHECASFLFNACSYFYVVKTKEAQDFVLRTNMQALRV